MKRHKHIGSYAVDAAIASAAAVFYLICLSCLSCFFGKTGTYSKKYEN